MTPYLPNQKRNVFTLVAKPLFVATVQHQEELLRLLINRGD